MHKTLRRQLNPKQLTLHLHMIATTAITIVQGTAVTITLPL
jgi:hypothetical protein